MIILWLHIPYGSLASQIFLVDLSRKVTEIFVNEYFTSALTLYFFDQSQLLTCLKTLEMIAEYAGYFSSFIFGTFTDTVKILEVLHLAMYLTPFFPFQLTPSSTIARSFAIYLKLGFPARTVLLNFGWKLRKKSKFTNKTCITG